VDGAIALEDGVVAEQMRQAHVGACAGGKRHKAKEQDNDSERWHGENLATQNNRGCRAGFSARIESTGAGLSDDIAVNRREHLGTPELTLARNLFQA
jgi:hypothetical protein